MAFGLAFWLSKIHLTSNCASVYAFLFQLAWLGSRATI